jgi:hypothetical protein
MSRIQPMRSRTSIKIHAVYQYSELDSARLISVKPVEKRRRFLRESTNNGDDTPKQSGNAPTYSAV